MNELKFFAVYRTLRANVKLAQGSTEVSAENSPRTAVFARVKRMETFKAVETNVVMA